MSESERSPGQPSVEEEYSRPLEVVREIRPILYALADIIRTYEVSLQEDEEIMVDLSESIKQLHSLPKLHKKSDFAKELREQRSEFKKQMSKFTAKLSEYHQRIKIHNDLVQMDKLCMMLDAILDQELDAFVTHQTDTVGTHSTADHQPPSAGNFGERLIGGSSIADITNQALGGPTILKKPKLS